MLILDAFTHLIRPWWTHPYYCAENANKASGKNPILNAQLVKKLTLVPRLLRGQIPEINRSHFRTSEQEWFSNILWYKHDILTYFGRSRSGQLSIHTLVWAYQGDFLTQIGMSISDYQGDFLTYFGMSKRGWFNNILWYEYDFVTHFHTLEWERQGWFSYILWYEHVRVGIKMDKSVVLQRQLLGTNQLVNVRQHLSDTFVAY